VPLTLGLRDQGFRALHATDGHQGLELARAARPNLVLLDAMLPRMDGFTVCRTLRKESAVPIIMFSTRGNVQDRIKGLELGADDYVVKSFNARELMARVRALLRRWQLDRRPTSASRDRVVVGDIVLDRAAARSGEPAT